MKILNVLICLFFIVSCNNSKTNVLDLNLDELTKYKIELAQEIYKNGANESILSDELVSEYLLNPTNVYIDNVFEKAVLEKIIKRGEYLKSLNNYSVKQNEYLNFKRSLLPKPKPKPQTTVAPDCECSESQAQKAAYDIIRQYEKTQKDVNSDLARCFKQDELRKISNCNYILTIIQKNCWNNYENIRITKKLECIGSGEFYVN